MVALHCDHSVVQARLVIHKLARQTMLNENLNILRALGSIAYPELADVLSRATAQSPRRLVNGHEARLRYGQQALTLWTNHVKVAHIFSTDTLTICATFTGFLYLVSLWGIVLVNGMPYRA